MEKVLYLILWTIHQNDFGSYSKWSCSIYIPLVLFVIHSCLFKGKESVILLCFWNYYLFTSLSSYFSHTGWPFLVLDTIDVHYMKKKVPQQKESHVWNNMKIFLSTFSLLMDRYLMYMFIQCYLSIMYSIKQKKVLVISAWAFLLTLKHDAKLKIQVKHCLK